MTHDQHACTICQLRLALYGESYLRVRGGELVEHIHPIELVRVHGAPNERTREAVLAPRPGGAGWSDYLITDWSDG